MKIRVLIMFLIMSLTCEVRAQESKWLPSEYKDLSFKEFVSVAQKLLKVKFYYKDEWVKNLKMGEYPDSFSLRQVLDNLLRGTSVFYFIDRHGNVVLTKDFEVKVSDISDKKESSFIPPSDFSDQKEEKQQRGNTFVEIGNPADRNKPDKATLSGYITDGDTRERLAGVTILDQKLSVGTISNSFGFYTLKLSRGTHTLQFSFLGMKEKMVNLNIFSDGEMNVEMKSTLIPLKETVIYAQKKVILQRFEVGVEKINISIIQIITNNSW